LLWFYSLILEKTAPITLLEFRLFCLSLSPESA
jgi:hypothetical protein